MPVVLGLGFGHDANVEDRLAVPGPSAEEFGQHIQWIRRRLGFDTGQLADRAGLRVDALEELEAGHREPIYAELQALAVGLGLSLETLFRSWERPRV